MTQATGNFPDAAPVPPTAGTTRPSAPAGHGSGRRPRTYWLLVGGYALSRTGAVVIPFLAVAMVQRGLTQNAAAEIVTAFGAGWLLGQPLAGWCTDRLGCRATIITSLATTGTCYLFLSTTTALPVLLGLVVVIGAFCDASRTAVTAWIADLVPQQQLANSFGVQYWLTNLGTAASGAVGGYLAAGHLGQLCLADATACALFAALVASLPAPHSPHAAQPGSASPKATPYRAVLTDLRLVAFTLVSLAVFSIYLQMLYGLPLDMHDQGLPVTAYGAINVTNGLIVLVLQPLLQRWINSQAPLLVCAAGALLLGCGMGLNAMVHSQFGFCTTAVIWTCGEILWGIAATTHVTGLAPETARGRYLGVWGTALGGAMLIAPLAGAFALARGPGWLWGGCAALGAASAATVLALLHRPPPSIGLSRGWPVVGATQEQL
jgi:MFS family permease